MTSLEIQILTAIHTYIRGHAWRGHISELCEKLGYRASQPIRGILRDEQFQAVATSQGTAMWISNTDGKVRLVDTTAIKADRPYIGRAHCRFCLLKEQSPERDLIQDTDETDGFPNSYIHRRCARSWQKMRRINRLQAERGIQQ